jgi:hypothetical protein
VVRAIKPFIKPIAGITNQKFIYDAPRPILQRNITNIEEDLIMEAFEYLPVGIALVAVVARITLFLPRQPKNARRAG